MKRHKILSAALLILIVLCIYLFATYRFFYFKLQNAHISWPETKQLYVIGSDTAPSKLYIALGDSLTYGVGAEKSTESYPYLLADNFAKSGQNITLVNKSYPGYKTSDIIEKNLDSTIASKPDIITILIGVNDAHHLVSPVGSFAKNYDTILEQLTTKTNAKIYVLSVPHLGSHSILLPPYGYFFDKRTRLYNIEIEKLAKKYQVTYVDIYSPTLKELERDGPWYSKDAYHPSAKGYKQWSEIFIHDTYQ